ncbi:unnamed protein product [Nyctereutes procyonoides]|uniref:(raccoon dog) hypothetical protein n=1 Tax=Nyctereutes procyonoides TaxID=34880 RepID=A0A811ZLJ6_NYCPR|nr:unnamed protein product [Nyctereutes procyonoides]
MQSGKAGTTLADKPARGRFATGLVSSNVYTTEGCSGPEFLPGLKARVTRSEQGLKGATASPGLCPSGTARAPRGRTLAAGLGHLQPAPGAPRPVLARRGGPAVHAPASTPRPSSKRPATWYRRSSLASATRHSVILWTLRSLLGLIAWIRRRGGLHRAMLSAPQAQAFLTCASILGRLTAYVPQLRLVTPGPTSAPSCAQDVSTGKTAWRAWEEEEDPALKGPPDARRRCAKGSGAAQPAFRPFRVDRSPCSFVPRPGPLHRSLPAEGSDDTADKESHPSSRSSCRHRNAISSSYSSTREFPSVQRRRAPARRQGWLPPTPPDKVSQDSPSRPAAPSVPCQMKNQRQEEAGATTGQKETCRNRSPTSDCSRPRRRKMPLLPHRPGDPVRLPPAPVLGFRVTAEDLDGEKRAALQRIDRALRGGEREGISRCGSRCPSTALPWPATQAVVLPAVPPAPGLSAQRAEQDSPRPLAVLSPGGGAVSVPPLSQGEPSSPGSPSSLSHPSSGTSAGLAPQPASDIQVTPMDCTPPCQSLLLGDSMGSVRATTGLHAPGLWSPSPPVNRPSGNPGNPAQPTLRATDGQCQGATTLRSPVLNGPRAARASTAARALTSALGQLSLGSATLVALGGSSPTSCTSGTHAGTQPGFAATPAVVPPGTATAPGFTKHNPVSGGQNAPPLSPSPRDLAAQRPPRPSPEPSSTASEATFRVAWFLGPTPRGAASVLSTARSSPARSSPSSAAQGSRSRKRAAPGHKSFPDTSQSTLLGSRRKMRA